MGAFYQKTLTIALATAFAASPVAVHAKLMCDAKGENCFDFVCLKPDVNNFPKVEEVDTELCVLVKTPAKQRYQGTSSRPGVLAKVTDACKTAGGVLEDKGAKVACTLGHKAPNAPARK